LAIRFGEKKRVPYEFIYLSRDYKNSLLLCVENGRTVQGGCIVVQAYRIHYTQGSHRTGHERERERERERGKNREPEEILLQRERERRPGLGLVLLGGG
jgi:hypothetical protein